MKPSAVTVQLQVPTLAELRNSAEHCGDGGERETGRTSINTLIKSCCQVPKGHGKSGFDE